MRIRVPLATAALLCCVWSGAAEAKKTMLDDHLYTNYSHDETSISFVVCGFVVGGGSGCFGSGVLYTFEQACAVLEGTPKQKNNIITRAIYVLDKRTSDNAPITLTVFTRTDTFANGLDSIAVAQTKQISLGITGGAKAACMMVANDAFVYAGTTADPGAVAIDKKSFALQPLGSSIMHSKLKSITADERGWVAIHFNEDYLLIDPAGGIEARGGGTYDMVGTRNAWKP
jgi:hypothetical protein